MIEKAVTFGPESTFVGVLCEPDAEASTVDTPIVLLFNTGIHHHVGPYRFNVDVARALASEGIPSLRFDLSGMGDSPPSSGGKPGLEGAWDDVRVAMAFLEKRHRARGFILIGFCSGVDVATPVALSDPRIVGLVQVEGYAYPTIGSRIRRPLRLLDTARWQRWLSWRLDRYLNRKHGTATRAEAVDEGMNPNVFSRAYPARAEFAGGVRALSARGVRMLFLYFGGTDVSHAGQLREMIRHLWLPAGVEVEYYPRADHIMFRSSDRARVVTRIARFCSRNHGKAKLG